IDAPDFSLTLFEDRHLVPRGGTGIVRVRANRTGFNGAIKLSLPGLPAGVSLGGAEIPAGVSDTLLSLVASPAAEPIQTLMRIVGQAEGQVGLQRPALLAASPIASGQPWLRGEVGIAITDAAPLQVAWDTSEPSLAIGSSYPAKVKVTRAAGIKGPVRLSALTSQLI